MNKQTFSQNKINLLNKIANKQNKLNRFADKFNRLNNKVDKIQKDKEICENGNVWYYLTLDELESKEAEILHLKKQLSNQSETIKQIQKLSSDYFTEPKTNQRKILAYTDVSNEIDYFRMQLKPVTNYLFDNAELYHWKRILNGEKTAEPVHVSKGRTIKQVLIFFEALKEKEIIKNRYKTTLCNLNAIYYNGKPLTTRQLKNAQDSLNTNYSDNDTIIQTMIDNVLKK